MKEVTYEEWQKNPTPREMWVWDDYDSCKVKRKVVYINDNINAEYPVIAMTEDEIDVTEFKHCAEIEEPKNQNEEAETAKATVKGFYVFNPNREKPSRIHKTLEEAMMEAERLSRLNPAETFEVLSIIGKCKAKVDVNWEVM